MQLLLAQQVIDTHQFLSVDLGQLIIGSLVAIVGWFIKKEIATFGGRLDRHEDTILKLAQNVSTVTGQVGIIMALYSRDMSELDRNSK